MSQLTSDPGFRDLIQLSEDFLTFLLSYITVIVTGGVQWYYYSYSNTGISLKKLWWVMSNVIHYFCWWVISIEPVPGSWWFYWFCWETWWNRIVSNNVCFTLVFLLFSYSLDQSGQQRRDSAVSTATTRDNADNNWGLKIQCGNRFRGMPPPHTESGLSEWPVSVSRFWLRNDTFINRGLVQQLLFYSWS